MMKKGIIFDLDGTLWDACDIVTESWNIYLKEAAADLGIQLTVEQLRSVMGKTMTEIGEILMCRAEPGRRAELTEGCCTFEVEYLKDKGGILYPDLLEVFETLSKEYSLYIVSNCQEGYIEDFIGWSHTESYIEDIENFGRTGREKSYNIRLLAERNKLDQAVYVGDTEGDYNSTVEAGLPFIHAAYGFGKVPAGVPAVGSLKELPEAVRKVQG
ncbi:MAG: HAD family hydrolase [Lachnospiraceae bacterium]|nr:HAD family hydrolase [Lachnospiraceae bacterium]